MDNPSYEQLRETLLQLERSRQEELRLRLETEAVLNGLNILTHVDSTEKILSSLLDILHDLIQFDQAQILMPCPAQQGDDDEIRLCTIAATVSHLNELTWEARDLFKRVLNGKSTSVYDIAHVAEWQVQTPLVNENIKSALLTAFTVGERSGMIMCTHARQAYFTHHHNRLVQHFVPLAAQMMLHTEAQETQHQQALNEKEEAMQAKIQHVQKLESLGVLAGGIAHDFNNILATIMGNAAVATRHLDSKTKVKHHLQQIEDASQHAADLCQQMLAYSGRGQFETNPVEVSQFVKNISGMLQVSVSKKVSLIFEMENDLPAIKADTAQLQQIVMNLVINGSEAIGQKSGKVIVSTGVMTADQNYLAELYLDEGLPTGDYVYLQVSDTGCGMDADIKSKIFDPFFSTKFAGRGLGMSAVLGIVRGHKGGLFYKSEQKKGTTFRILFPILLNYSVEVKEPLQVEELPLSERGTILVVDDNQTVLDVASVMLEDVGYSVLQASNGLEGIEIYTQHQDEIVAVLLDLTMPQMDGVETMKSLQAIKPDVKVILSSGYCEEEVVERLSPDSGLMSFIQKPYKPEKLERQLRKAIEQG